MLIRSNGGLKLAGLQRRVIVARAGTGGRWQGGQKMELAGNIS